MSKLIYLKSFILSVCFSHSLAFACQTVATIPDHNCDGIARVGFIGDSIVYGQGDTDNNGVGGYVKRFSAQKPNVQVKSYGVTAITTGDMLSRLKRGGYQPLRATDIVVIDIGRNDCRTGNTTRNTLRDLRRIVKWARNNLRNETSEPFVVVAAQIPNRNYRRACIEALNQMLLANRSKNLPVYLRYDRVTSGILSGDGLHPTSFGYTLMTKKLLSFFNSGLLRLITKEQNTSVNN